LGEIPPLSCTVMLHIEREREKKKELEEIADGRTVACNVCV